MNPYLVIILAILIGNYVLDLVVEWLNLRHLDPDLPQEFVGYYDEEKYRESQSYLRDHTRFEIRIDTLVLPITLIFILAGGFNFVDRLARSADMGPILTGLIFAGVLVLASQVLQLPAAAYRTFVIEERYGFNRTTVRTFIMDRVKGLIIGGLLGGAVFSVILWFFAWADNLAWLYCWGAVTLIQLVVTFVAPVLIMPLFNKYEPLEDGELKHSIESYAAAQRFRMKGLFSMDGSRRSSKSNAFFTGFGRFRRIVLYDTLIKNHDVEELTAVVAHEMGHYKRHHIAKFMLVSVMTSGLMFYLLSFFIQNEGLFAAFRMEQTSIYASLIFFGFLYAPIASLIGIATNATSRRYEFEADRYVVETYGRRDSFITALKKLSVDNLSNLTPHDLKVMLYYSHPPVLRRITAIRRLAT